MNKTTYLLVCVALGLAACGGKQANPGVDAVFLNANVYTVNAAQPSAEAVAIDDGAIVYVGDNAGAEALIGDDTTQHDLAGQLLLPGFIDTHVHPRDGWRVRQGAGAGHLRHR